MTSLFDNIEEDENKIEFKSDFSTLTINKKPLKKPFKKDWFQEILDLTDRLDKEANMDLPNAKYGSWK
jgi:hypothetical protein